MVDELDMASRKIVMDVNNFYMAGARRREADGMKLTHLTLF
jgi:hypothetical protein